MTKEVLLSITGLQFQTTFEDGEENGDSPMEVITPGSYYLKNGKHYVVYDEVMEGLEGVTKNTIKINDDTVEVIKRGVTNVHLKFEKNKKNISYYDTPFGNLLVGTHAHDMRLTEDNMQIQVKVDYTLEINYEYVAECSINMEIKSKEAENLNILES